MYFNEKTSVFQDDKTKTWRNYVIIVQISVSGYSGKHHEDFELGILSTYPLENSFKMHTSELKHTVS